MKKSIIVLFAVIAAVASYAQTAAQPVAVQKIGYADPNLIFSQLPEFKQIENELKTHNTQLENQMKAKVEEYQNKVKAFQSMPANTSDIIKADKEREIVAIQENMQKFEQDASASLQKKQTDLMQPIYNKIAKAIEDVAKEQGYSFVLTSTTMGGADVLLYSDEKYDISTSVLKKLGVTPAATPAKK
ncbi:MAG: OmpH family outer membrane protein [Bacteroidota bacterium]